MKKGILTLLTILCLFSAKAQDVIVKKNGDEINAKIEEITTEVVKYRRYDYQEGPLISLARAEVFMVKYANGTKEVLNAPTAPTAISPTAPARTIDHAAPLPQEYIKLGGPRLGFTVLAGELATKAKRDYDISPFLTQFGWQFETQIFSMSNGLTGLAEFVPLIGGLEQGSFLPSLSALMGLRTSKGFEFGVGPNLSPAGTGLVFALGTNFQSEGVNFPLNLAVVPSKDGARFSLLIGFNSRKY